MTDENKKFPDGWGDNNDDDDYGFIDDTDEDDDNSAWGNSSPFEKSKSVTSSNTDKDSDEQAEQSSFTDKSKEQSKQSIPIQEIKQPEIPPPPAPSVNYPYNTDYIIQKRKTSPVLIIVIIILVLIIGVLGGMFFMMSRDKKSDKPNENAPVSTVKEITDIAAVTTENVSEKATKNPIQTESSVNISCSKNDVNQTYADIVKSMDFPPQNRGFILDLNNDDINEMIIPNTDNMNFVIYYFDGNSIQSCSFGNFMALDNFVIYQVDGEDNKNYIYYRDNYAYKSLQGYYSFPSADKLDIFINYPENNGKYSADWTIDYNKTKNYAKGNESVDTFYGQPSDCHDKLLSAFKNYGFEITENSKYTEVKGLYYDELIKALTPDSNLDSKSKPSAKVDIQIRNDKPMMANVYLCVSGDYSYYEYEIYLTGADGSNPELIKTGTTSDSEVLLGEAPEVFGLKVYVTPYNSSDIAGEKVVFNFYDEDEEEEHKKVEVYSCNSLGTINTCGSTCINGYSTSYIVNGDSLSCVRTDLRNGWHVTAVNYCTSNGTTWYELYDTDDGDYYGWVDSSHINFSSSYQGEIADDERYSEDEGIQSDFGVPVTEPPVTASPQETELIIEPLETEPLITTNDYDSWYDYGDYSYDYSW